MRHRLREADKQHLSVLHGEMVQFEWGVLRDAKGVDFAYAVHRVASPVTNEPLGHVALPRENLQRGY